MDLCIISDLHEKCEYISSLAECDYDLLIICGDITNFGHFERALRILELFPEPFLAVHGNCDYHDVIKALEEKECNVHKNTIKMADETFCGFGGGNIFLKKTPSEYTEEEIYNGLSCAPKNSILVTHVPPLNTATDRAIKANHVGSTAVRQVIEENEPKIAVCGHIHESRNTDFIKKTLIVNPGEFSKGYYALVDSREGTCSLEKFT